jgi:hypothetical protein
MESHITTITTISHISLHRQIKAGVAFQKQESIRLELLDDGSEDEPQNQDPTVVIITLRYVEQKREFTFAVKKVLIILI